MGLEIGSEKFSEECFEEYLKTNYSLKQIDTLKDIGTIDLVHHAYTRGLAKGVTTITSHVKQMIQNPKDHSE